MSKLLLLIASISVVLAATGTIPEQIHIALAGLTGMRIMWYTASTTESSVAYLGTDSSNLNQLFSGSQKTYLKNWGSHHTVLIEGLSLDTDYFYQVGDNTTRSSVFSFRTPTAPTATDALHFAVLGDMGYLDSVQRPMGVLGSKTMAGNWSAVFSRQLMESWKDKKAVNMVWHMGDVGYADDATFHSMKTLISFEYEDAYNGYMNWIQNLTAVLPYHVCPGNHESECHDPACIVKPNEYGKPLANFTAFNARWAMPSEESGGVANMWYSWDYGSVHFVSIDSETDFPDAPEDEKGDSKIFAAGKFAPEGTYLRWLEADLQKASADPNVAWIVAGGHRPFSYYSASNKQTLEDLFSKYGVAMYFAGHAHSYSRFDAADHNGVVHITVGGAGCEEMLFTETNPVPGAHTGLVSCEQWADYQWNDGSKRNKIETCAGAAFFTDAYAIGQLTVEDNGRGDMKWELYASTDGSVIDSITLKKPLPKVQI